MNRTYSLNDWKKILSAQADYINQKDSEEKRLKIINGKQHLMQLNNQLKEKNIQKQNKLKSKEYDALVAYSSTDDFSQFTKKEKIASQLSKKQLFNDLTHLIAQKEKKIFENSYKEHSLDLQIAKYDNFLLEKQLNDKNSIKHDRIKSEQEYIELKNSLSILIKQVRIIID